MITSIIKAFSIFILLFNIILPAYASGIPAGVTPQKGYASVFLEDSNNLGVKITFWNVGQLSGDPKYSQLVLKKDCSKVQLTSSTICSEHTYNGTFSGGPNGSVAVETEEGATLRLVDGKYFNLQAGEKTWQVPILNPDIFEGWNSKPEENKPEEPLPEDPGPGLVNGKLEDSGAGFSDIYGQVECNWPQGDGHYDKEDWHSCKLNTNLPVGTHIKSMEKSGAIISYSDMSTFVLKPESEIILSSPTARDSQIKLLLGNLWVNVKKMLKDGTMQVEMSQAVAGIKGTRLILTETGKESTLQVTEGTVNFKLKNASESAIVIKGESLTATSGKFLPKTKFDPVSAEQSFQQSVEALKKNPNPQQNKMIYIFGGVITVLIIAGAGFILLKKKR